MLHTSKRLVGYSDPEDPACPIRLSFSDGTEATCDVVVGADGVKSAVRATMLSSLIAGTQSPEHVEKLRDSILPRYSGAVTHRAVISREKFTQLPQDSSVWTVGKLVGSLYS